MIIKILNRIDDEVARDVNELVSECHKYDGPKGMIAMDTSYNFNKDINTIYLMYDDKKLVSAMTLFIPGPGEAEVSAMTLPEYRRQGCFAALVEKAESELKKYGVPDLLFVCEGGSESGKAVVASYKAKYEFTEYFLKYNHLLDSKIKDFDYRLKLHKAGPKDLDNIIRISMDAFGDSYEGAKSLALGALNTSNRQTFLGEADGEYVAMGVAAASDNTTSIHGLGVLSEQQGKGYGKEMLYSVIKELLQQEIEDISIEVDSENSNAFQLYRNSGFEVFSSWEYYRKAVE